MPAVPSLATQICIRPLPCPAAGFASGLAGDPGMRKCLQNWCEAYLTTALRARIRAV
jgi:hypothetical protein